MNKENWIWMPHAGHFICWYRCRFRMNTYVGGYIVSTVGEMILEGIDNEREMGFEEVGSGRLYETMVFKAQKSKEKCCPWEIIVSEQMDMGGYNNAVDAYEGHMKLCEKWSKINQHDSKCVPVEEGEK